ncbi:hypothetical protein L3Q82_000682 [Scortum barcoo]|uniref:Uncharacterized protein n=1 Tax=Scortum barcoo TaxID=214431 RepID=A0ACB8WFT5_9TELE|nr:hypothetical protein L3Q82_000682 [Scortum barcoo]
MFYQSVVASVLFYTVVCWGGSISKKDTSRLDKLIRRAGSVVGMKLDSLVTVGRVEDSGLLDIMDNASHPLHTVIISNQRSLFSERLLLPKCERLVAGSLPTGPGRAQPKWPWARMAQMATVAPPSSRLTTRRKVHEGRCNVVWVAVMAVAGSLDDPIPGPENSRDYGMSPHWGGRKA